MILASKVVFLNKKLEREIISLDENDPIRKSVSRAVKDLRENAFAGIQISKKNSYQKFTQKGTI